MLGVDQGKTRAEERTFDEDLAVRFTRLLLRPVFSDLSGIFVLQVAANQ